MAARKYDWDRWFEEGLVRLEYGKDYTCSQSAITQVIRNRASRRGLLVSVTDHGDAVTLEVTGARPRADKVAVAG